MAMLEVLLLFALMSLITEQQLRHTECKQQGYLYDCSNMELTSIPRDIPRTISDLDLSSNHIKMVRNHSFPLLYNMSSLRLDQNKINEIEPDAFVGLISLKHLQLESNNLYKIPYGSLSSLVSLYRLNIHWNQFSGIQMNNLAKEIANIDSLQTLSIDISPGFRFPQNFYKLTKLTELQIYGNDVSATYSKDTFMHLAKTPITNLFLYTVTSIGKETFYPFQRLTNLKIKIRSVPTNPVNEIFQSFAAFKGRNMTRIELNENRYKNEFTLGRNHLRYMEDICLREFVLQFMFIGYVNPLDFQLFSMRSRCLEYLEMSENTIFDEEGAVLFENIRHFKRLKIMRFTNNDRRYFMRSERSTRFSVSSNATVVLPSTLEELYVANSFTVRTPSNYIFINGLNMRVLSAPNNRVDNCRGYFIGLENLKYFDITGWTCKQLSEHLLTGFPNLVTFIASNSYIGIGFENNPRTAGLFTSNRNLQHIDLSRNWIRKVPDDLFIQPFECLNQVNLSLNKMTSFPNFPSKMKGIKTIDLSYNLITSFNDDEMKVISEIGPVNIHLQGNPLQCSCKTLNFMKWLNTTENVVDFVRLQCILEDGSRKPMSEVLTNIHDFEIKCSSKFWLVFSVSMISLLLIGIIFVIIYFRYKFAIEYILLKWKMWWNGYRPLQTDYTYDAFVSYSHHDSSWAKQFHDKLNDMGFNLCLDAKDFIAGRGIAENVMTAIDSSRKVIFIITRNFLGSDWGSFELEMTRMHAFREHREEMVIIVLKDNIRLDEMPKVLKNMWYKITCIQWPDDDNNVPFHTKEIFFEKMKHALRERRNEGTNQNLCV